MGAKKVVALQNLVSAVGKRLEVVRTARKAVIGPWFPRSQVTLFHLMLQNVLFSVMNMIVKRKPCDIDFTNLRFKAPKTLIGV